MDEPLSNFHRTNGWECYFYFLFVHIILHDGGIKYIYCRHALNLPHVELQPGIRKCSFKSVCVCVCRMSSLLVSHLWSLWQWRQRPVNVKCSCTTPPPLSSLRSSSPAVFKVWRFHAHWIHATIMPHPTSASRWEYETHCENTYSHIHVSHSG